MCRKGFHKKLKLKAQSGMSMAEITIALAIMGIVSLGVMKGMQMIKSSETKVEGKVGKFQRDVVFNEFMLKTFTNAGISQIFLHLPVKLKGCDLDEPCLREYDQTTKKFINTTEDYSSHFPDAYIDFYRDASANLGPHIESSGGSSPQDVQVYYGKDYLLSGVNKKLFVTWVLKDETSKPFPVLLKAKDNFYLEQPNGVAGTGTTYNYQTILHAVGSNISKGYLKGRIFLLYSASVKSHYFIKYAKEVKDKCDKLTSACRIKMMAMDSVVKYPGIQYKKDSYMLNMQPLTDDSAVAANFIPASDAPSSFVQWNSQSTDFYIFPTEVFSINGGGDAFTPSSNMALHRISHFYDGTGVQEKNLRAFPVELGGFKLVKGNKCRGRNKTMLDTYNLIFISMSKMGNINHTTILDKITSKVLFYRELGTSNLQFDTGTSQCIK